MHLSDVLADFTIWGNEAPKTSPMIVIDHVPWSRDCCMEHGKLIDLDNMSSFRGLVFPPQLLLSVFFW